MAKFAEFLFHAVGCIPVSFTPDQMRRSGVQEAFERYHPDLDAYHRRARGGPCFVCAIVAGDPEFPGHPVVYQDEFAIAFLTTNPTQYGYALVCPKEHREQATGDFSMEEYLGLQRLVYTG
jgi:ATP adenylyltransferase